jgi:hypothetical protein
VGRGLIRALPLFQGRAVGPGLPAMASGTEIALAIHRGIFNEIKQL